jgi:hydrogenase-4 membrane subunit HyfE
MSLPLVLGCVWVFLATIVAALPMRRQYAPGSILLIAAPFLLGWIAFSHGLWIFGIGLFALISMFRNPLKYLLRRARGEKPEIPV